MTAVRLHSVLCTRRCEVADRPRTRHARHRRAGLLIPRSPSARQTSRHGQRRATGAVPIRVFVSDSTPHSPATPARSCRPSKPNVGGSNPSGRAPDPSTARPARPPEHRDPARVDLQLVTRLADDDGHGTALRWPSSSRRAPLRRRAHRAMRNFCQLPDSICTRCRNHVDRGRTSLRHDRRTPCC